MSDPNDIAAWLNGYGTTVPNGHVDWVEPHPDDHDDLDAWNAARAAYALPPLDRIPAGYGHTPDHEGTSHE